jgi:hypothetical protein
VGCAIAQAVSFRLPTAAVRVRSRHVGFVVDKVALGGGFLHSTSVSHSNSHQMLHTHHLGLVQ